MVDTKDQSNAIVYAMLFVDTVNTGVCGSYTTLYRVMRCENSTLLCIQWPKLYMLILSIQNTSTHFCP